MTVPTDPFAAIPCAPATPVVAIGDVHGCADLLQATLDRVAPLGLPVVLMGDYIDHGPASAAVLALLQDRAARMPLICLRGNHEELLLRFLARPLRSGRHWLRYGAAATLASFGLAPATMEDDNALVLACRDGLRARLGAATIDWLQALPYRWQSGNLAACHAGFDPDLPIDRQQDAALVWGHPAFGHKPRGDGLWCLHGHRIVPALRVRRGVISVDTGAWQTGKLCAALIGDGPVRAI